MTKTEDYNRKITLQRLKADIHQKLLGVLDLNEARRVPVEQLKEECLNKVSALLDEQQFPISGPEKEQLLHDVMDEVFGFGP